MDEKMKILEMVKNNTISTEEAMELLKAVEEPNEVIKANKPSSLKGRFLRILIEDGDDTVKVNLPITMVEAGMKIAGKFDLGKYNSNLEGIDLESIMDMIHAGSEGKLVEIDTGDNEHISIYID